MKKMMELTQEEFCMNMINTVDRIMGRYGASVEEACSIAGITIYDYSEWKENMENYQQLQQETQKQTENDDEENEVLDEIVMHKIPELLKIGITLENACEFARISVEEYEAYRAKKCSSLTL